MNELPPGWDRFCIHEIGGTVGGKTPSKAVPGYWSPPEISWASPKDMKMFFLSQTEDKISQLATSEAGMNVLPSGSVLMVTRSGILAHTFPVAVTTIRTAINQDIKAVLPNEFLDPRYLAYALRHYEQQILDSCTKQGTTVASVETRLLERLQLPLAPLNEQRLIADRLDRLIVQISACKEHLARVPTIIKHFKQSVLAAATSGELTRDWRESNSGSAGWVATTVADVASQVFDGPFGSHLKSKDYAESGIRVVRLENLATLRFVEDKRTYISKAKYEELKKHTLWADDILFSSFVDQEVRVCLLPDQLDRIAINKADCFCVRTDRIKCRPLFLALRLACRSTYEALDEVVHGATRPRINLGQLRAIRFDLPPLDEQDEIVARSSRLLEFAEDLERRLFNVKNSVERAIPSALAKAFRGELVPQDPDEESASELIRRMRVSTTALSGKPSLASRKKRKMSKIDKDAIKVAISKQKNDCFSFEDLRVTVAGDYESVKDALFEVLEEPTPIVRQVFDKSSQRMQLVRLEQ